jgi:alanyl-tRNA synthetase
VTSILSTNEIRKIYLDFFQEKGHTLVESAPLVPLNDPTLLFINAGMAPFKDLLLGVEKRSYNKAVSSQRCMRAGGKHNDLDNVGYTARHHTFFEMLGNFSFGDYFKEEAIFFAWELLTERYKISPDKLWITVHESDNESEAIWIEKIGIAPERISRLGDEDNFWTMGDTGPCGPCSEIFYDHGDHLEGDPPRLGNEPGDRFIEIWNLVFTQFDRDKDGSLTPLPNPCVDTGMGLERVAAVLQNEPNNYDTDILKAIVSEAGKLTGQDDLSNPSLRVIADHLRAASFLIADGVIPSNEGRGYVLRRIIRRALRHSHKLEMKDPILSKLVPVLEEQMSEAHPVLTKNSEIIKANLSKEEEQFSSTLEQGMQLLESAVQKLDGHEISGEIAFKLYDTYGFPVDMTADFARERNLTVDMEMYDSLMLQQRERARSSGNFSSIIPESLNIEGETNFVGYESHSCDSNIVEIFSKTSTKEEITEGEEALLLLNQTPFYAESGGQTGDKGYIESNNSIFEVYDTQKKGDHFLHIGYVKTGSFKKNDTVKAEINSAQRNRIKNNHSATHLLHASLRQVLGEHVEQKGSLVEESRLRFDFAHNSSIESKDIEAIEDLVNAEIAKDTESVTEVLPINEAIEKGAVAFFGDKYGEEVRVLDIGEGFSIELCGGTHVERTGEIGVMKITSESGISAGVRRIEAVTSDGATFLLDELEQNYSEICNELLVEDIESREGVEVLTYIRFLEEEISSYAKALNSSNDQVLKKIIQLKEENLELSIQLNKQSELQVFDNSLEAIENLTNLNKLLKKDSKDLQSKDLGSSVEDLIEGSQEIEGYKLITSSFRDLESKELRDIADRLRNKSPNSIIALISISEDKAPTIVACSKDVDVDAREIMKHLINQLGGSGGGRPDFAQGGVENTDDLDIALASVADLIVSLSNQ